MDKGTCQVAFGIISLTGPLLGIVLGGNVSQCLGGIRSRKTLFTAMGISYACMFAAFPVPYLDSFIGVCFCCWFLLFFGGSLLPYITGVMLQIVPKNMVATANSIANLNYNLLGFLPAPVIYGAIYDSGEGKNGRLAMKFLMFAVAMPGVYLTIASYFIIRDNRLGYIEYDKEQEERL